MDEQIRSGRKGENLQKIVDNWPLSEHGFNNAEDQGAKQEEICDNCRDVLTPFSSEPCWSCSFDNSERRPKC